MIKNHTHGQIKNKKIKASKIEAQVEDLLKILSPLWEKYEIAGEYRRKIERSTDIKIVVLGNYQKTKTALTKASIPIEVGTDKDAKAIIRFYWSGSRVDLLFTQPQSWGATLVFATGPESYVRGLKSRFKQEKGMNFTRWGVFDESFKQIGGKTEKEVFKLASLHYVDPENR